MAVPAILTSIWGRKLGLAHRGRLVAGDLNPGVVPAVVYTNEAASAAVSNTTAETLFSTSYTVPGNSLSPGQLIRIRYQGIATATNATDSLAIKLYLGGIGGITLLTQAAQDVANNDVFQGEYVLIVRSIGAAGTVVGCGTGKSVASAEGTMTAKDDILPATAIDTTSAKTIGVSATWSAANAGNSCRLDVLVVELG
jgi:hypothetical protein